jgi:hypothetical protein
MMAGSINDRIKQLRSRRDGSTAMTMDSANALAKALYPNIEPWEKRASTSQPHTRYAIGAMQPVSDAYTKVSIETADRVINQLRDRLPKAGIDAAFRLQGSVPLDVHIKGVSDVDLLVLDTDFFTYKTAGARAVRGGYTSPSAKTSLGVLSKLRAQIESDLVAAFPAANVDKTGAKAVKVSGGSLARDVDVVPAHWLDTIDYQSSGKEIDRGVIILNKKTATTIENLPFLHIDRIRARCIGTGGGLRKAIRLCKNVKEDSDKKILLPSFDIAATMYHADMAELRNGLSFELAILAETQRHLDSLACNPAYAKRLFVPDLSRPIFDTDEKWQGLLQLSQEMDDLLSNVYIENAAGILSYGRPMSERRMAVSLFAA